MNYLKFYKLDVEPYRNDPDQRFYYESDGQRQARLRVMRGIYQRKGLMVIVGEPGRGKTTLSHHLLEQLDPEQWAPLLVVVPHVACANGWLLPQIAAALGEKSPGRDTLGTLGCIEAKLDAITADGRHVVLMIDEAQLLADRAALAELRGLLNLLSADSKRLSIVLLGPPDLDAVLRLDASLAQRVEIRVSIGALNEEQARAYLTHRLEKAGAAENLFTSEALDAVYTYTGGIPRLINTLCDNALFEGFLNESLEIDASLVSAAAEQLAMAHFDASEPSADPVAIGAADPSVLLGEPPVVELPEPEAIPEAEPEPEPESQPQPETEPPVVETSAAEVLAEEPQLAVYAPELDESAEADELEVGLELDENIQIMDEDEVDETEVDFFEDEEAGELEESPVEAAAVPGADDDMTPDTGSQLEALFEGIQKDDEDTSPEADDVVELEVELEDAAVDDDDDELDQLFEAIQVSD